MLVRENGKLILTGCAGYCAKSFRKFLFGFLTLFSAYNTCYKYLLYT